MESVECRVSIVDCHEVPLLPSKTAIKRELIPPKRKAASPIDTAKGEEKPETQEETSGQDEHFVRDDHPC